MNLPKVTREDIFFVVPHENEYEVEAVMLKHGDMVITQSRYECDGRQEIIMNKGLFRAVLAVAEAADLGWLDDDEFFEEVKG